MSRAILNGDYVEHFDPELPHHWSTRLTSAWQGAPIWLEQLQLQLPPVALSVCPAVSPSRLYRRQAQFTITVAP